MRKGIGGGGGMGLGHEHGRLGMSLWTLTNYAWELGKVGAIITYQW